MIKNELIDKVYQKTGLLKKDIEPIIEATFEAMAEALLEDEKVKIANFGTFERVKRDGYIGVHPVTGEPFKVKPFVKVKFTSSSVLKEKLK